MGFFGKTSFIGSCFKGWGSNNMAVQAVGMLVGTCLIGFFALWYIVKGCIHLFEKHQDKKELTDNTESSEQTN